MSEPERRAPRPQGYDPMSDLSDVDPARSEDQMHKARRGRNIAMLVVLVALVALFYAITIVKMM